MSRDDVSYEKKYRYMLYRIQQALLEMSVDPQQHRGRRHLENALYSCEGHIFRDRDVVTHEEMTAIKEELFKDEPR